MNDQKQQIIEKLRAANNVLVTVSSDPSLDQLAACIGLTLVLNKLDKHATAVFSGQIPSTIGFLNPEETIEQTTDSLRDFIISLDKSKADKLRYKVEDDVVKIFITPYRSSITEKDLVFGQGDFNVDVIVGLGVHRQTDLDNAITAHGRILHDAAIICINNTPETNFGSINWLELSASSLSELVAGLVADLGEDLLDTQSATALLAGIVAETDHFGNHKTMPQTMTMSARLLEAGANQQLVSSHLAENALSDDVTAALPAVAAHAGDGTIEIPHPELPEIASDGMVSADDKPKEELNGRDDMLQSLGNLMDPASAAEPPENSKDAENTSNSDMIRIGETQYAPKQPVLSPEDLQAIGIDPSSDAESSSDVGTPVVMPEDQPTAETSGQTDTDTAQQSTEPAGETTYNEADAVLQANELLNDLFPQDNKSPESSEQSAPAQDAPSPPDEQAATVADSENKDSDSEGDASQKIEAPQEQPSDAGAQDVSADAASSSTNSSSDDYDVDSARKAVEAALQEAPLEPLASLNAMPVHLDLRGDQAEQDSGIQDIGASQPESTFSGADVQDLPNLTSPSDYEPQPATADLPAPPLPQPANEPAPLSMSPADQPYTMPLPQGMNVPQPAAPAGPPSPPSPPATPPPSFGAPQSS